MRLREKGLIAFYKTMPGKRKFSAPAPQPSYSHVYAFLGLSKNLEPVSADANRVKKKLIVDGLSQKYKILLRRRHAAKLHRNLGLIATPCLLSGYLMTSNSGIATACVFTSILAGSYAFYKNTKAITANIKTERPFLALPKETAKADDTRLNAELILERVPHSLFAKPVRATGAFFDRCFGTPAP